jgi:uncharacterized membrane protein YhiD involved in acid resistance
MTEVDVVLRVAVAVLAVGLIGPERSSRGCYAGLRTNAIARSSPRRSSPSPRPGTQVR